MTTFTKEQLQQIEAAAKEALWPVVWSEKKARAHFSKKITPEVVLEQARIALLSLCTDTRAQPVIPDEITSASAPEVFEIAAEAERLGLRGTYASYAVGWNAYRAAMLKAQQKEPQNIPENIPAPLDAQDLELYVDMLENSDSDDEDGELNNTQLIVWLKELQRRRALSAQPVSEPKAEGDFLSRLKAEFAELQDRAEKLAAFIQGNPAFKKLAPRMQRLLESQIVAMTEYAQILECRIEIIESQEAEPINAQPVRLAYKLPNKVTAQDMRETFNYLMSEEEAQAAANGFNQCLLESNKLTNERGWIKGQFAYQDLFNAIGAAVVSKHPSIEISVKAFEDSMLAAAPAQDGKSASTELPNHSNLSTNSPVIPDGSVGTSCIWSNDSEGVWLGDCGVTWQFFDDGPNENGLKYCPSCGKKVSVIAAPAQESE